MAETVTLPVEAILDAAAHLQVCEHVAIELVGDDGSRVLGLEALYQSSSRLLTAAFGEAKTADDAREQIDDEVHGRAADIGTAWLDLELSVPVSALLRTLAKAQYHGMAS